MEIVFQSKDRLDRAIIAVCGKDVDLSRAAVQRLIRTGCVTLNGKVVDDPANITRAGDVCRLEMPSPEPSAMAAQKIPLTVVYEDERLLVVDKPAGLVVHPGAGNRDGTLANALLAHCAGGLSGIGGVMRPGIVHRLDKDTSGLMVVAKDDASHRALSAQFADRSLSRVYLALAHGVLVPPAGKIEGAIGRNPRSRQKMAVVAKGGKAALTNYRVLERFGGKACLVECRLATGRTHQIRAHMAHIKHPLIGDTIYGGKPLLARQALHAAEIKFLHPASGKQMRFQSPLPTDMAELLERLRSNQ